MSLIKFFDRVKHTVSLSGTFDFTLEGANVDAGFVSFADTAGYDSFGTFLLAIVDEATGDYEIGEYTEGGFGAFTRGGGQTVLASSNSGNEVNFSAGDKSIFMVSPAYLFNLLNYDNDATAPKVVFGREIEPPNGSYTIFSGASGLNPEAFLLGAMGPKRSHQSTQVCRLRTTNGNAQPIYTRTFTYDGDGLTDSQNGITYIKAIVTAIGSVGPGTTYEGRADTVECVILHRGSIGSSVYIVNTVTAIGSDGAGAATWTVTSTGTAPGFTITVTGAVNSEVDWAAEVHIIGNGRIPLSEA